MNKRTVCCEARKPGVFNIDICRLTGRYLFHRAETQSEINGDVVVFFLNRPPRECANYCKIATFMHLCLPACLSQISDTNFPQGNLAMKPTYQDCKTPMIARPMKAAILEP